MIATLFEELINSNLATKVSLLTNSFSYNLAKLKVASYLIYAYLVSYSFPILL